VILQNSGQGSESRTLGGRSAEAGAVYGGADLGSLERQGAGGGERLTERAAERGSAKRVNTI